MTGFPRQLSGVLDVEKAKMYNWVVRAYESMYRTSLYDFILNN